MRFAGGQERECVLIRPLDDGEVEGDETFSVSLVSVVDNPDNPLEHRIHLYPNRATLTISDDDG